MAKVPRTSTVREKTAAASKPPAPRAATGSAQSTRRETRAQQNLQRHAERRREAERAARNQRIRRFSFWGGLAVIAAIIVYAVIRANASTPPANIAGVVTYSNLSRNHVTGTIKYAQVPPVGGDHNAIWLNCGIYDAPVANENAVHSMEHGAVWITYLPSLSSGDVARLRSLVSGHSFVILSPYPGLPSPVVASAWGVQLKVQSVSDPRIAQFIHKYEQGPQTPEPGAQCSGGTGTPIG